MIKHPDRVTTFPSLLRPHAAVASAAALRDKFIGGDASNVIGVGHRVGVITCKPQALR